MQTQAPRSPTSADRPLTLPEVAFIEQYAQTPDDVYGAARRAGYAFTSRRAAEKLRRRPAVAKAIEATTAKALKKAEVTAETVIAELARVALSDIRELFDEQGRLVRPHEWTDDAAAAVASFDVATTAHGAGDVVYVARVRTADKVKALELLAKHFGLVPTRLELRNLKPLGALTDATLRARARELLDRL